MMKLFALALVCFVVGAGSATAQDVVGSSLVDGKRVQLLSDFTWRYAGSQVDDCITIEKNISFCARTGGWKRTNSSVDADAKVSFRKNDRSYGLLIVEAVGSEDGMTAETMRGLVIGNAADAAGVQAKDVPVLGVSAATVDGRAATTVVYSLKISGLNIVYLNTIVTQPKQTVQVVTYGIGAEVTDQMTQDHREFIEAVHFK